MKTTAVRIAFLVCCRLAAPECASAQDNPLSYHGKYMYAGLKSFVAGSAQKMPAEHFNFKPTEEVRTFGQIIGHIADAQYLHCSIVMGEKTPKPEIEKTKTSKAELIAALKDVFAYCDRAHAGMTDAIGVEIVPFGGGMPKLGVLTINNLHTTLHYGNLITYMRLKNVVPPSSDPSYFPAPPKK